MAPFPYTIGFWNARSASSKLEEVEVLAQWVHVVGIAEPGALQCIEGFYGYGGFGGPGVVLFVHGSVPHRLCRRNHVLG